MRLAHKPQARRGVLLLVVLGMLAMFGVIGITFVILTSHERRGAEAARRVEQYADPADDLLNQAMFQALAGTENTASVLRSHSLLEDLYGTRYRRRHCDATVDAAATAVGRADKLDRISHRWMDSRPPTLPDASLPGRGARP